MFQSLVGCLALGHKSQSKTYIVTEWFLMWDASLKDKLVFQRMKMNGLCFVTSVYKKVRIYKTPLHTVIGHLVVVAL